jgi:hypothetical protein
LLQFLIIGALASQCQKREPPQTRLSGSGEHGEGRQWEISGIGASVTTAPPVLEGRRGATVIFSLAQTTCYERESHVKNYGTEGVHIIILLGDTLCTGLRGIVTHAR